MATRAVNRIIGDVTESLVVEFVGTDRSVGFDIPAAVKAATRNVPRGARPSVASAAQTKLHLYTTRCRPSFRWSLIDAGVCIGSAGVEVDMVLESIDGGVVVEELKAFTPSQARGGFMTEQVERQLAAGVEEYRDEFLGVRWITLDFLHHSRFFSPSRTRPVPFPTGLEAS